MKTENEGKTFVIKFRNIQYMPHMGHIFTNF